MDKHVHSRRPRSAGGIRRRADVDGYMPRPLGFIEVVWTEVGEFAANCRKASEKDCVKEKEFEVKKKVSMSRL